MSDDRQHLKTAYQVALWRAGCFEFAYLMYRADEFASNPDWTFDQFCREFGPFAARYSGRAELRPMPGDAVRLGPSFTGDYWDYARRAGAILNGWVGHEADSYLAVFGAESGGAFRGPSNAYCGPGATVFVDCSGGPCIKIPVDELKLVGNHNGHFWAWRDYPRADGGEYYRLLVPLWEWATVITPN